ncbi:hypothetical protein PTKU46_79720 [Paraburkholderia terrae]
MHARTWRLSDNQDARVDSRTRDRTRTEWQVLHACKTGTHVSQSISSVSLEEHEYLFIFRPLHFQIVAMG